MSKPCIAFVGMTHLGICSAAAAALRGFETIAYDRDGRLVERLKSGEFPIVEPGLAEAIAEAGTRLRFTDRAADLAAADVAYAAPDIATDDSGRSDTGVLEACLGIIEAGTRPDAIRVVLSQVAPGFTRRYAAGRRNVVYQVETLIFGRAVERATQPERFIVGCADPADPLPPALAAFLASFGCPILPMGYESAELAKISINFFLIASVSAANTLAELCEKIGADWSEIAPALRLDRRIGAHAYLNPGLGISGGNLERDMASVLSLAAQAGTDVSVVRAWIANSAHRRDWPARILARELYDARPDAVLGVLGLAYKENTRSTKNSASLALLAGLGGKQVSVFDPWVSADAVSIPVRAAASAIDCARGADALAILTPWPEFARLDPAELAATMAGRLILDPYGMLDPARCRAAGLRRFVLGAGNDRGDS
jgi:UDPglucose 6-dehydrogenase